MVKLSMDELNLTSIVVQYSDSLNNSQELKGLIYDLYPRCPRGLVNIVVNIVNDGIMQEIQNAGEYSNIVLSRRITRLENNYGYFEKLSRKAIK